MRFPSDEGVPSSLNRQDPVPTYETELASFAARREGVVDKNGK